MSLAMRIQAASDVGFREGLAEGRGEPSTLPSTLVVSAAHLVAGRSTGENRARFDAALALAARSIFTTH